MLLLIVIDPLAVIAISPATSEPKFAVTTCEFSAILIDPSVAAITISLKSPLSVIPVLEPLLLASIFELLIWIAISPPVAKSPISPLAA